MYTECIKIGDNSYILSEDDGNFKLITCRSDVDDANEIFKLENEYEKKEQYKKKLQYVISEIYQINHLSKEANIFILFFVMLGCGFGILTGCAPVLISLILLTIGVGSFAKLLLCGTRRKRNLIKKNKIIELEKISNELELLKYNIDTLKEKMKYSELDIHEDEIISVTTVENKKANVKMRVLKLNQSR